MLIGNTYLDSYYLGYGLVLIAFVFMLYAQMKIQSAYRKYSAVGNYYGYTGYQVARNILDSQGLQNIEINLSKRGQLSDFYDPRNKTVNLSNDVYHGTSVASVAIAAHEVGHALQDKLEYYPLKLRSAIVPIASVSSSIGWVVLMVGFLASAMDIALFGVVLLSATLFVQVVTLPVEFNASSRALFYLEENYLYSSEVDMAKKVLSAAALTYVASMFSTMMSILRLLLMIVGNNSRRRK